MYLKICRQTIRKELVEVTVLRSTTSASTSATSTLIGLTSWETASIGASDDGSRNKWRQARPRPPSVTRPFV